MIRVFALLGLMFSLFLVWIIFSADTGRNNLFFELVREVPYGDKWGHLLMFGSLTLFANVGSNFKRLAMGRFRPYLGATLVAVVVFVEECSQAYFPNRTFDLLDLLADAVGIALFSLVSYQLENYRQRRTR